MMNFRPRLVSRRGVMNDALLEKPSRRGVMMNFRPHLVSRRGVMMKFHARIWCPVGASFMTP
jgi:hypothetical protein